MRMNCLSYKNAKKRLFIQSRLGGHRIVAVLTLLLFANTAFPLLSVKFAKAEEPQLTLPDWEFGIGAGGYFFEGEQEYDPGGLYQIQITRNLSPKISAETYFAGMPQLNDNPPEGLVPFPADIHNWGLQWGGNIGYHFNEDPGRRVDPFVTIGGGIEKFQRNIDGDHTHVYGSAGLGLAYRFTQNWSIRGDYRSAIVGGDTNRWNQMALFSLGYSWENPEVQASSTAGESRSDQTSKMAEREREGEALKTVYFDFDSAVLREDAKIRLRENAQWMKQHPQEKIILEGHCDERGTTEYNFALGERRARSAFNYLRALGVPASQISTVSYGEERPADPGHNEAAWAKNRRVECRGRQ